MDSTESIGLETVSSQGIGSIL